MSIRAALLIAVLVTVVFPSSAQAIVFEIEEQGIQDDVISVGVVMTGITGTNCPDGKCYIQGVIKSTESSRYFGYTLNNYGDWIDYDGKPGKETVVGQYAYFEVIEGTASGVVKVKSNPDSEHYKGPGKYLLKLNRFTGRSDSPSGESNTIEVQLTSATPSPVPTPIITPPATTVPTPLLLPTPTAYPTPRQSITPRPTVTVKPSPSVVPASEPTGTDNGTFVLGEAVEVEDNEKRTSIIPGFMIAGGGVLIIAAAIPFAKKALSQYN